MTSAQVKTVLILSEHFAPAYKAGGIVRCLQNLVATLGHRYHFYVLTSNHDLDGKELLEAVTHDAWVPFGQQCEVYYASYQNRKLGTLKRIIQTIRPATIYVNGLYSIFFTLFPCWLARNLNLNPPVIAPWGMLQHGCLSIKPARKRIYLFLFKSFGFSKHAIWHATNPEEQADILRMFGEKATVRVANALPNPILPAFPPINRKDGILRMITISLVARKKGHLRVITALKNLQTAINAEYHIYGPIKDTDFWQACLQEAVGMSDSIKIYYHGFLDPSGVLTAIQENHLFVLHSDGENFSQAIYEALVAGRPVLTSNLTPWNNLQEEKAGWNVGTDDLRLLERIIKYVYHMSQENYSQFCLGAYKRGQDYFHQLNAEAQYHALFQ